MNNCILYFNYFKLIEESLKLDNHCIALVFILLPKERKKERNKQRNKQRKKETKKERNKETKKHRNKETKKERKKERDDFELKL